MCCETCYGIGSLAEMRRLSAKQLLVEAVRVVLRDEHDRPTLGGSGAASRTNPAVHVIHSEAGWRVETEGAERPHSVHQTQAEAWAEARAFAQSERVDAFLHGLDGRIREQSSFDTDT